MRCMTDFEKSDKLSDDFAKFYNASKCFGIKINRLCDMTVYIHTYDMTIYTQKDKQNATQTMTIHMRQWDVSLGE
jgi:hypothetical protein